MSHKVLWITAPLAAASCCSLLLAALRWMFISHRGVKLNIILSDLKSVLPEVTGSPSHYSMQTFVVFFFYKMRPCIMMRDPLLPIQGRWTSETWCVDHWGYQGLFFLF